MHDRRQLEKDARYDIIILVVGWLYDPGPTDRRADCPPFSF